MISRTNQITSRRTALKLLAGGAVGAGMSPLALAAPGLDLADPADFLTAIAKMRGSTDDRLVIGWLIGRRYAVINSITTPIMGILAGTFSRFRRLNDQVFEGRTFEVAYFTDLDTGKLLENWTNPVTGATVKVPQTRMGPSSIQLTAMGLKVMRPAGQPDTLAVHHSFLPAVTHGDDVWISEDIRVSGTPPFPGAKPFAYNEMTTYQAKRADLDNPLLAATPTQVDFHSVVSFRPWMAFGDTVGHTTARGSGGRAARMEDLPPYYLELTEQYHPDVFKDPLAVLSADTETE